MGVLEKFTLGSLSTMDGERIAIAFEQALKRVVQDCDEARAQSASGEIPEKLVFDVNVFSNINSPGVSLWFALDIDANIEAISINPIGDCIGDAYRTATRAIVSDLKRELPKALVVACCD